MPALLDTSSEFAHLVSQLQESPDNPALKQAVVSRIPEMMALAEVNPLARYRLAQIYPPSSAQHKLALQQSADSGCTNAMLALCQQLVKSNNPADMKKASYYMSLIMTSKDSYIIKHSKPLLEKYPQLAPELKDKPKSASSYAHNHRFFTALPERKKQEPVENNNDTDLRTPFKSSL